VALALAISLAGVRAGEPVQRGEVVVTNPLDAPRTDLVLDIPVASIREHLPGFEPASYRLTFSGRPVPSQIDSGEGGLSARLLAVIDLAPRETVVLLLASPGDGPSLPEAPQRAQADLAVKTGYRLVNGEYTGGQFQRVQFAQTPPGHRSHNAYFKYEGPGWESDLIGYRLYLDERNRCDIFGKKIYGLVLHTVGVTDLVSDGKESYQSMQPWGRDIYKVGATLGVGSFALWENGTSVPVENFDGASCRIQADGPVLSRVGVEYTGWRVGGTTRNAQARLSIAAGSRLTEVQAALSGPSGRWCTGLAKHPGCGMVQSPPAGPGTWGYLGWYGAQTLTGDSLGTALVYRGEEGVEVRDDSLNLLLLFPPGVETIRYFFGAAWEQEPGGIRSAAEFRRYLDDVAAGLNAPVQVSVRAAR
jgi:hypothetical protein